MSRPSGLPAAVKRGASPRRLLMAVAIGLALVLLPDAAAGSTPAAHHDPVRPRAMRAAAAIAAAPPRQKLAPFAPAPKLRPRSGTATSGVQAAQAVAAAGPARQVFGFVNAGAVADSSVGYPSWNMSLLSTVAFFGLHVDSGTGRLVQTDTGWSEWNSVNLTNLLTAAHDNGVRVVVSIILQDTGSGMCTGLGNAGTTVSDVVSQVQQKGVDGVNVDYEGVNETCGQTTSRALLTTFVQQLHQALPSGSSLSVDTYATSAGDSGGFFDVGGMAPSVDAFFVMAYELDGDTSGGNWQYAPLNCSTYCFSPTSPLGAYHFNDTTVAQQYLGVVPASKVILGLPYYGWTACAGSPSGPRPGPNAVVQTSGANWTSPTYLDSVSNPTTSGVSAYQPGRDVHDTAGQEPFATWLSSTYGCWRESYWDDPTSLSAKYDLVNRDNLGGVGMFTLDYGGGAPELWNALAEKFTIPSISSVSPSSGAFAGGETVTIGGQNLRSGATVKFGNNVATNVSVTSSTQLTATAPAGYGTVDVTVTNPGGASGMAAGAYTYAPAPNVKYFTWYDMISDPGFKADNIHVVNPGSSAATVVVNIPGSPGCTPAAQIGAGQEQYFSCPNGFGGPVTVSSDVPVLASQRVQYYQSFNEVVAQDAKAATTSLYFTWFDRVSSPGFKGDNIHVLNPGTSAANVTVHIPGCSDQSNAIAAGAEWYATCPSGFGGPVKVSSDQAVLASQRVQYYQSFNEVVGQGSSAAQSKLDFTWFDRVSSPGFQGDNVHVINPGTVAANVTVHIPGCSDQSNAIAAGGEWYATCPGGFGGPVTVSSDQAVLASQRVQYYQSFNEVLGQGPSSAQSKLYFTWFDRVSSPGFQGDNVHVINPGTVAATVTVQIPSCADQSSSIGAGQEGIFTCSGVGGPVVVTSDQPVLASQRVQYYQSFNEVLGLTP